MTVKDLETLFDYGYWANGKLFDVVGRLTPGQFAGTLDGSHGSVRKTLVHMLSAESVWLNRFLAAGERGHLDPRDFPTGRAVADAWGPVEAQLRQFLSTLRDDDLAREIVFMAGGTTRLAMPLGQLLQQVVMHGVHHRGQVSLLLRLLGQNPENFDVLLYHVEKLQASE